MVDDLYADGGDVDTPAERFGKSGIVEVKPRHASRDDVQELIDWLEENSWKYERATTNESRQQNELPYIQISTTNVSRDEIAELRNYLINKQWEFVNLYASGGNIPNNYKDKTVEQVWNDWTIKQRSEFIDDHKHRWEKFDKTPNGIALLKYEDIPDLGHW